MALSFDNEFESLFAQSPIIEGVDCPNSDDIIVDDVPFCNSLLGVDNFLLSNVIQGKGELEEKSTFYESDSRMSGDLQNLENSEVMDDEHSLDETFLNTADRDLLEYFGCGSSSDEDGFPTTKLKQHNKENVDWKQSLEKPKFNGRVSKTKKIPVSNVAPIARPKAKEMPVVKATIIEDNPVIKDDEQISNVQMVKVVKVIKTSPTAADAVIETCDVIQALEEKNKKNAYQAKVNREKKKAYIQGLETEVEKLQMENNDLKSQNETMTNRTAALEEEVEYLKSVLANESSLSKLLKNIDKVTGVRLSTKFQSRKRSAAMDHCYDSESTSKKQPKRSTAGVCLHVDNEEVSLEFCSHCSRMSKSDDENK